MPAHVLTRMTRSSLLSNCMLSEMQADSTSRTMPAQERQQPATDLDPPSTTILGPQLQGLEPADILRVVEHPPHHCLLLVNLHRVARQHNLLQNYSIWITAAQCTCIHGIFRSGSQLHLLLLLLQLVPQGHNYWWMPVIVSLGHNYWLMPVIVLLTCAIDSSCNDVPDACITWQ